MSLSMDPMAPMAPTDSRAPLFIGSAAGRDALRDALSLAGEQIDRHLAVPQASYRGLPPAECEALFAQLPVFPEQGMPLAQVLDWVGENVLAHSMHVNHPHTLAHLHCPPLVPGIAADLLVNAANQSMDSWDQAPAATYLEQRVIDELTRLIGMPAEADGIFTSGGTQSNFMGLLLARDDFALKHLDWNIQRQGLPREAAKMRVLCSEVAHFSVQKSASILGLGTDAVVTVACDGERRMDPQALERSIAALRAQGLLPFAVVGTAGTTDFGSIDPLDALAAIARREGLWLHVDAAYGGALALSQTHRAKLTGLASANSIAVDFHKLFFQPISCGALLVGSADAWETLRYHADYLNPEENEELGVLDLVTKSIQTTRRFDGLKLFVTMQTLGRRGFSALIDGQLELARQAAATIEAQPELMLVAEPSLVSVVFRYVDPALPPLLQDRINAAARRALLLSGQGTIGMTRVDGRYCVKFTLMNPQTRMEHLHTILDLFIQQARREAGHTAGSEDGPHHMTHFGQKEPS